MEVSPAFISIKPPAWILGFPSFLWKRVFTEYSSLDFFTSDRSSWARRGRLIERMKTMARNFFMVDVFSVTIKTESKGK
jgi:hypothetical protein